MLIERLAQENRKANNMQETPEAMPTHAAQQPNTDTLIGGRVSLKG